MQHLHPTYPSNLAELLSLVTAMPVREVTEATSLRPDCVYVIPPNTLMTVSGTTLHLSGRPEGRRLHMPIDHFFQSLAGEFKSQAIGIVLSGAGTDGTQGLEAIKGEGGISFAQDATAKFEAMPQSAAAAGCVDAVLPPEAMAAKLVRISRHPYVQTGAAPVADVAPRKVSRTCTASLPCCSAPTAWTSRTTSNRPSFAACNGAWSCTDWIPSRTTSSC